MTNDFGICAMAILITILLLVAVSLIEEFENKNQHGIWWNVSGAYCCSKCGATTIHKYKFCPNCGADMRSDEE